MTQKSPYAYFHYGSILQNIFKQWNAISNVLIQSVGNVLI